MKKFIAISLSVVASNCFSLELKLECETQSTYTYPSGRVERNTGKALIEVKDQQFGKAIFISSAIDEVNDLSVSTFQMENKLTQDFSDMNKWEIKNEFTRSDSSSSTRILIDRNSGMLIVDRVFRKDGMATNTKVSGLCKKIDTSTRRF